MVIEEKSVSLLLSTLFFLMNSKKNLRNQKKLVFIILFYCERETEDCIIPPHPINSFCTERAKKVIKMKSNKKIDFIFFLLFLSFTLERFHLFIWHSHFFFEQISLSDFLFPILYERLDWHLERKSGRRQE